MPILKPKTRLITFTTYIQFTILFLAPIAYEQDLSLPRLGDKCQVSGWKNANSKLIHWNVTIVDDSLCGDAFEKYNATENLGCAQGEEVNKYRFTNLK